jgi:hypothetical protein
MTDAWDEDTPAGESESQRIPVEPRYPDVETWVTNWLSPLLRRNTNTKRAGVELAWCPQWWAHAEAIDRLESIWRAWEAARISNDPAAVAHWWTTIADPMLAVLLDADTGPFSNCRRDGHHELPALTVQESPHGWWSEP